MPLMHIVAILVLVAVVYFPVLWVAGKIGGERLQNIAILLMVSAVLVILISIPVAFYLFLRYGLT